MLKRALRDHFPGSSLTDFQASHGIIEINAACAFMAVHRYGSDSSPSFMSGFCLVQSMAVICSFGTCKADEWSGSCTCIYALDCGTRKTDKSRGLLSNIASCAVSILAKATIRLIIVLILTIANNIVVIIVVCIVGICASITSLDSSGRNQPCTIKRHRQHHREHRHEHDFIHSFAKTSRQCITI